MPDIDGQTGHMSLDSDHHVCVLWQAGNEQGGKSQEPEETMVANLVTGCVSFLLALYQCTSDAQLSTSFESVVGHALKSMRPRSKKNEALYSKIQAELANLKG